MRSCASSPRRAGIRSTARRPTEQLVTAIATKFGAKPENVVLGAGSQEILKSAVRAFTSPTRGLVTAAPSFENCPGFARQARSSGHRDQGGRSAPPRPRRHGCGRQGRRPRVPEQPEQPDGDGARQQGRRRRSSRRSAPRRLTRSILIDEAYHDYVTDPSYESAIPLAMQTPNVFVARTFSKAYGMAGLRIGYAIGQADDGEADGAAEDALQRQRLQRGGGDRRARRHRSTSTRSARATPRSAPSRSRRSTTWDASRATRRATSSSSNTGQAGRRVPRCLRQAGDHGGPAVPAAREDARAHLARHDGRNEEGRRPCSAACCGR